MNKTTVFATALAAALAIPAALACPADTSLEDGPAVTSVPHRHAAKDEPRACAVRLAGNPKMMHPRSRAVSCRGAFATRPAEPRDAA